MSILRKGHVALPNLRVKGPPTCPPHTTTTPSPPPPPPPYNTSTTLQHEQHISKRAAQPKTKELSTAASSSSLLATLRSCLFRPIWEHPAPTPPSYLSTRTYYPWLPATCWELLTRCAGSTLISEQLVRLHQGFVDHQGEHFRII